MSRFLLPFTERPDTQGAFSPAGKLLMAAGTGLVITAQAQPLTVAILLALIIAGAVVTHTRWRTVLDLALRFETIVVAWILIEPFIYGQTVIARLTIPFGSLPIFAEGLEVGLLLGLRMMTLLLLFLIVLSHMTLSEFVDGLRTLHVPFVIVSSLMVMLRYIPLFMEERNRLQEAQTLRGFHRGTRVERISSLGYLVGTIIDRALDRSVAVYESMTLKGLGLGGGAHGSGLRRADAALLLVPVVMLVLSWWLLPVLSEVVSLWYMRFL